MKSFNHFYIQVFNVYKAHLLEGTQEYAKQQELKLAEDKVDLMIDLTFCFLS